MTKEEKQKKDELLAKTKEAENATVYMSGIYLLLSIIGLWTDMAEDNLKKLGIHKFSFKQDFNRCKNMMNGLEVSLREYGIDCELLCKYFDIVEPELMAYLFKEAEKCNKQNQYQN